MDCLYRKNNQDIKLLGYWFMCIYLNFLRNYCSQLDLLHFHENKPTTYHDFFHYQRKDKELQILHDSYDIV